MILHIFRTKVMNRGLNSKRLLKKIKKMGKGLPQSLPGGKKVSPSYATASQSLAWRNPQYAISDGTFALALAGFDGGSAETGGAGLLLAVLGGSDGVHLFEKA